MKQLLSLLVILLYYFHINAQTVGIGTNTPDASAKLDVSSTTKGVLIPRMTTAQMNAIATPANGLLIFNITIDKLVVNAGTTGSPLWQAVGINNTGWELTGNAGINPGMNFIGTTDNQRLVFRTNNVVSAVLDPANYNSFYGYGAGGNITTGGRNIAVGLRALFSNQTRNFLIAIGDSALYNNNTGSGSNIALGSKAGFSTTSGSINTFIGKNAGLLNETGFNNIAIGNSALEQGVSDESNIAIGNGTITNGGYTGNPARRRNIAIGDSALHSLYYATDGNVAIGYKAAKGASYGGGNVAIGFEAASLPNLLGSWNIALGYQAMNNMEGGNGNVGLGYQVLYNNVGSSNVGLGYRALYFNTGSDNIAIGDSALYANVEGYDNVVLGNQAAENNLDGKYNVAIGHHALQANTGSGYNIAIGDSALLNKDGGTGRNTVVGSKAGYSTTTGAYNCFYGRDAAKLNTIGGYNVAIGHEAMDGTLDSDGNVVIGREASSSWDLGNNNTLVGSFTAADADGYSNSVGIGYLNVITASNQVRLGWLFSTSIGGYQNWSNISDGRYKKNIRQNVPGLDFIMALKPVTYNLDVEGLQNKLYKDKKLYEEEITARANAIQTGFIAQDVEAAAKKLAYDFSGVDAPKNATDMYGLRYAEFVVPLVKAVQEQQQLIAELKKSVVTNIETEKQLKKENDSIYERLKNLEEEMNKLKLLIQNK